MPTDPYSECSCGRRCEVPHVNTAIVNNLVRCTAWLLKIYCDRKHEQKQ